MSDFEDKDLICINSNCPSPNFTWTAGEQEFFAQKGFNAPKRCIPCRKEKTREMNALKPKND